MDIHWDFRYLTQDIKGLRKKPHLRPAVASHLRKMGHSPEAVEQFLDSCIPEREQNNAEVEA